MKTLWLALQHYGIEFGKAAREACPGFCMFLIGAAIAVAALVWVGTR